ncbi:MAG: DUF92 domain-containing protein [Sphaerochaetaceae bacterium]|jgi:uncharacterized protein (TIGR00297 family)|nr:DUF92 domain-containing protein [Sphaerochaetaceae bacterium]NLV84360.1 DUF92 domain-containing protein [Spirochaetales bacterium]
MEVQLLSILLGLALNLLLAFVAWRMKWLTLSGSVAAFVVGFSVFWCTRFDGWLLLMLFFITANILGKISRMITASVDLSMQKKGSQRDWIQVLANGALAALSAMLFGIAKSDIALVMFGSAVAAATADTWSGEAGILSRKSPVSIVTGKPVPKGQSGGITFLGTFSGLLGALIISIAWYGAFADYSNRKWLYYASIITVSGFIGTVVDSLLGATLQGHYWDPEEKRITEREYKNGVRLQQCRGIRWIDNDAVNFLSGVFAVLAGCVLSIIVD